MRISRLATGVVPFLLALPISAPAQAENQIDLSSISSTGTPEPVRTGFYMETSLGAFMTLGGGDSYSNMEAFLALGAGYDILDVALGTLSAGLQFQLAPSAGDCYITDSGGNDLCSGAKAQGSSTFTMAAVDAVVSFRFRLVDRLYIPARLFGGMADFTPLPRCDLVSGACGNSSIGDVWEPTMGAATGIEWATRFDHFTVGLELSGRFVPALAMTALAIYPRIKYTF